MIGSTIRLGRIIGVDIKLDVSWFLIFVLATWSLAGHYFPMAHGGWSEVTYWTLGTVTAALAFASVLAHELSHAAVARALGLPVRDITLFIFGGATQFERDPERPRDELLTALSGPLASLALAGGFGGVWWLSREANAPLHAVTGWLAWINLALGLFNLVPGFPLDGGRVLRAAVWAVTRDARRATRIAAGIGRMVALGFILWGVWQIFGGNWAGGLWIALIGWFLHGAATSSEQVVMVESLLVGHTVREVMITDCPHINRGLSLDTVVEHVVLPSGRHCFPVVDGERVDGILTLRQISAVPRGRWPTTRVQDVMVPWTEAKTVRPDDELTTALALMTSADAEQLPVVDDGRFLGMVGHDGLLAFLRMRAEARLAA